MYIWGEGLGRGSGRVGSDFLSAIAGRVGSGQRFAGSGRVGSKKSDPWTTLTSPMFIMGNLFPSWGINELEFSRQNQKFSSSYP